MGTGGATYPSCFILDDGSRGTDVPMEIDRKSVHASPERLQRSASNTDKTFYNNRILEFTETDKAGPLRASGGEFGGGERNHYCEPLL